MSDMVFVVSFACKVLRMLSIRYVEILSEEEGSDPVLQTKRTPRKAVS